MGEEEALAVAAAEFEQGFALGAGLDAFGDDFDVERAGESEDGAHDGGVAARQSGAQVGDEAAVDLERVNRELVQVGQR